MEQIVCRAGTTTLVLIYKTQVIDRLKAGRLVWIPWCYANLKIIVSFWIHIHCECNVVNEILNLQLNPIQCHNDRSTLFTIMLMELK